MLLTGKPIYVNGWHHPCPIDGGRQGTVDDIVRDPANRYVAAIGGDVHNYQRYPVQVGSRTIQYLVSGGGGAYMHPTHKIPNIDKTGLVGVSEDSLPLLSASRRLAVLLFPAVREEVPWLVAPHSR